MSLQITINLDNSNTRPCIVQIKRDKNYCLPISRNRNEDMSNPCVCAGHAHTMPCNMYVGAHNTSTTPQVVVLNRSLSC